MDDEVRQRLHQLVETYETSYALRHRIANAATNDRFRHMYITAISATNVVSVLPSIPGPVDAHIYHSMGFPPGSRQEMFALELEVVLRRVQTWGGFPIRSIHWSSVHLYHQQVHHLLRVYGIEPFVMQQGFANRQDLFLFYKLLNILAFQMLSSMTTDK